MPKEINEMFSDISPQYDFMNHLFSLNIDRSWRKEAAVEALIPKKRYEVLDVAAGTCDLAIAVSKAAEEKGKEVRICAYDFNKKMLEIGKEKIKKEGIGDIGIEVGNAFNIRHKAGSVDVITSGFGLRSFAFSKGGKDNLHKFISESYRVLKPGGKIILLDMAMPDKKADRIFFSAYSKVMLFLGSFVDREAYGWLVRTIKEFDKKELVRLMKISGFKDIRMKSLRSGIAYLVTAEK